MARRPRTIVAPGALHAPVAPPSPRPAVVAVVPLVSRAVIPIRHMPVPTGRARPVDLSVPRAPRTVAVQASPPLRILVRMPTRARAAQAVERLAEYRARAGRPIEMEVVADADDVSMQTPEVFQQLHALGCAITIGVHRSKIEAVNGGRLIDWDILVLASDDMTPIVDNWAVRVEQDMVKHFPQLDGALHYNDGHSRDRLCTLPILGRRLYAQFGYVYEPSYQSLWCDNEQTEVLRSMGRLAYIPTCIIEHKHPAHGTAQLDALYRRNDALNSVDKRVYQQRVARKFDAPPMRLSILIATLPHRDAMLRRLLDHIWTQALKHPRQVEVIVDAGEGTTGAKRQRLLGKARGEFVAFVDDDDWVSDDYVDRVLSALASTPSADCVEIHVAMQSEGKVYLGHCSKQHREWTVLDGVYVRCPNHLSPVRRTLATRVGFANRTIGEDYDYSVRLLPLLGAEARTDAAPLYFYYPDKRA